MCTCFTLEICCLLPRIKMLLPFSWTVWYYLIVQIWSFRTTYFHPLQIEFLFKLQIHVQTIVWRNSEYVQFQISKTDVSKRSNTLILLLLQSVVYLILECFSLSLLLGRKPFFLKIGFTRKYIFVVLTYFFFFCRFTRVYWVTWQKLDFSQL